MPGRHDRVKPSQINQDIYFRVFYSGCYLIIAKCSCIDKLIAKSVFNRAVSGRIVGSNRYCREFEFRLIVEFKRASHKICCRMLMKVRRDVSDTKFFMFIDLPFQNGLSELGYVLLMYSLAF